MRRRVYLLGGLTCGALAAATHPRTQAVDDSFFDADIMAYNTIVGYRNPLNPFDAGNTDWVLCRRDDPDYGRARAAYLRDALAREVRGAVWPWSDFYGWLLGI